VALLRKSDACHDGCVVTTREVSFEKSALVWVEPDLLDFLQQTSMPEAK